MKIFLNEEALELPNENMTVSDLLTWKQISQQGTAVAIGEKLLKRDHWNETRLAEGMEITLITAAFGG